MPAFRTPVLALRLKFGFGEFSIGLTAGNGIEGAGDADRRTTGEDPKDDRRLCAAGGFIGFSEDGVPGIEGNGAGDPGACSTSGVICGLRFDSGGAGLLDDIRRPGKSILATLLC